VSRIELRHVDFGYAAEAVIKDVTFDVASGGFCGIIGANGSGKSTLLRLMSGYLRPWRGVVEIDGRRADGIPRREMGQLVAVVPQETSIMFPYTVMEMVLFGRTPHIGGFDFETDADVDIARESMRRTNTVHLADRVLNELSGGERQRVVLARALAQQPAILLLDEPSAFLDIRHEVEIYDLLRELQRGGITVVTVLHDLNLAALYCEHLILLREGGVFRSGAAAEVMTYGNLTEAYGTEIYVTMNDITGTLNVLPLDDRHRARLRAEAANDE
jgi:iron complex transport system ATP-binding protein